MYLINQDSIKLAIDNFFNALGEHKVFNDSQTIQLYSRSTQEYFTTPCCILKPDSLEDILEIVQIASQHQIPLYPISRGKNWGYGDGCAVQNHQVIVDLSNMNRICEINDKLGYAVIEPGVTQAQLAKYLKENNLPYIMDVTGAGPDASIVGNTIERGFGHTPYGDHFATSCGYEVVLSNGNVLKTGFASYEGAKSSYIFKSGLGPSLDGLFTQSNLGIITKMGVWLYPKPEKLLAFVIRAKNHDQIGPVVETLRRLRMQGIIKSTVHVGNDMRVISSRRQCPKEVFNTHRALPEDIKSRIRNDFGLGCWNGIGAIYGSKSICAASAKEIKKSL